MTNFEHLLSFRPWTHSPFFGRSDCRTGYHDKEASRQQAWQKSSRISQQGADILCKSSKKRGLIFLKKNPKIDFEIFFRKIRNGNTVCNGKKKIKSTRKSKKIQKMMIKSIFKFLFGSCLPVSLTNEDKREPERRGNDTGEEQEEKYSICPRKSTKEKETAHKQDEERKESPIEREQPHEGPLLTRKQQKLILGSKKRATQRFTSFVTAKNSRLAKQQGMKKFLGESNWKFFCTEVETYRQRWKSRFGGRMECCGNLQGSPCPHRVVVDPKSSLNALGGLHLDHSIEVVTICRAWRQAVGTNPASWHQGIDKDYLLHLLFGLEEHKTSEKQETRSGRPTSIFAAVTPTKREGNRCAIVSIATTQRTPTCNARCKHMI